MARTKVVVTRQLIDEAQRLLNAKKEDLEVVQWQSEKVDLYHWREDALLTICTQPCPRPWLLENAKGATGILVMLTDKVDKNS